MSYYYAIERKDFTKFNETSELDMSRLGYFIRHEEIYPGEFPKQVSKNIKLLESFYGNLACDAWYKLTEETCMKLWRTQ